MTATTYRRIETEDGDGHPIIFDGIELGIASSERTAVQPRWTEYTIFKTQGGNYVLEIVGQTRRPGEVIRRRAHVFGSHELDALIEKLHAVDGTGKKYITYIARECLFQAMDADPELEHAWDRRVQVVA